MSTYYSIHDIASEERITDGDYTLCNGNVNPELRGLIFKGDNLVSHSFGYSPSYTPTEAEIVEMCKSDTEITTCFEGPLVKLWWDDAGVHLSTTNKLDCMKSYWGNKEERFGDLFYANGGQAFVDNCENRQDTHHFMIMTPSLMVTSELDIRDNECMVVYLGSMSLDRNYTNIEFSDTVFYKQQFNVIPSKDELNSRILYPHTWKIDDENYYTKFVNQILEHGYSSSSIISSELTMDEKFRGVDANVIKSYFGSPIIIRSNQGITKFVPPSYEKKCSILGNSPNIKLLVYGLMDHCRPKKDIAIEYFEKFDFLFVPSVEFMESLKDSTNVKETIIKEYKENGSIGFNVARSPEYHQARQRNLMLVLLLCLPQSKARAALDAYNDYLAFNKSLKKFIVAQTKNIIEGKHDEMLKNDRVINRLKDMGARSSDYASKNANETFSYNARLMYSVEGLVNNERGASLYKIDKATKEIM